MESQFGSTPPSEFEGGCCERVETVGPEMLGVWPWATLLGLEGGEVKSRLLLRVGACVYKLRFVGGGCGLMLVGLFVACGGYVFAAKNEASAWGTTRDGADVFRFLRRRGKLQNTG